LLNRYQDLFAADTDKALMLKGFNARLRIIMHINRDKPEELEKFRALEF